MNIIKPQDRYKQIMMNTPQEVFDRLVQVIHRYRKDDTTTEYLFTEIDLIMERVRELKKAIMVLKNSS